MTTKEQDALAKKRFLALGLIRFGGVALVLVGLLCALDKIDIPGNRIVGVIMIFMGMTDFVFMPIMLSRRWRSPDA
ncbi:MAG: hypothetical protein ABIW31_00650 [Novosphingobium sp.]